MTKYIRASRTPVNVIRVNGAGVPDHTYVGRTAANLADAALTKPKTITKVVTKEVRAPDDTRVLLVTNTGSVYLANNKTQANSYLKGSPRAFTAAYVVKDGKFTPVTIDVVASFR